MTRHNRFLLMPVLVSGLALIILFGVPVVGANNNDNEIVAADYSLKTAAACPFSGPATARARGDLDYHQWLFLHIHGWSPSTPAMESDRHPDPRPNPGLLQVAEPATEGRMSDARILVF